MGTGLIIKQLNAGNQGQQGALGISSRCFSLVGFGADRITNHNNVAIINGGRAAILVKNNTLQVGSVAGTNQHIGANNSMFNVSHNM